jgi:hypothetical protein
MAVYRLHPGKALQDSYTPQLLKIQVLLVYLASGMALLSPLWPPLLGGMALGVATLLLTTWPFTKLVARLDRPVAPWAPWFLVVRACAFAAGVAAGLGAILLGRPVLRSGRDRTGDG